ncbi:MAG TPA: DinB family protein [Pyrinomonadaceae bacterium]|nr:DinB family protein [Pyrinomonadaceae bacterium]
MNDWIEAFHQTIDHASEQLLQISEEQSEIPRATGKWSPKEIVGHLIDSAANNHQRFVRAQFTDELVFPAYEQVDWVRVQRYQDRSWAQLVELWRHYNLHLAHVMSSIPEETRTTSRARHNLHQLAWQTVDQNEPVTLEYFMRDYVGHLQHHLDQILAPGSTGSSNAARHVSRG